MRSFASTMCEATHEIEITNIKNLEKLEYPIVFIKGVITNQCRESALSVQQEASEVLQSCDLHFDKKGNGTLKLLVRLIEGENRLTLQYCRFKLPLTLFYVPSTNFNSVVPLYIICDGHDGHYQSDSAANDAKNGCRKVTLAIELLQCLYAEKLAEHNFQRKTFRMKAPCVPFRSTLPLHKSTQMTEQELWQYFATELVQSSFFRTGAEKFVAFVSSTWFHGINDNDFSYENIKKHTTGHVALGGGGLALFGTGCLYTWPETLDQICAAFHNTSPIPCATLMDDSNYRRTYGGCYATTIGSVCHEIGHIFDLGHTPDGIMGDALDWVDGVFTNTAQVSARKRPVSQPVTEASTKLTQIKQAGDVLRRYRRDKLCDYTFFTVNCAITLHYHRWFNGSITLATGTVQLSSDSKVVFSDSAPLRLVELRSSGSGMLYKYWSFPNGESRSFTLPQSVDLADVTLFAIDEQGNILKCDL